MGRSFSVALGLLLLSALLNSSVIPHIRIQGGGVDVVLVVFTIWIVGTTLPESILWAFIGGIFQDLLSLYPVGSTSLAYIIVAFLLDRLSDVIRLPNWLMMMIGIIMATIVKEITLIIVGFVIGLSTQVDRAFLTMQFITLIYNFALSLIVYPLVRILQVRLAPRSVSLQR